MPSSFGFWFGVYAESSKDEKYKHLFSVDAVNELVKSGMPFCDTYKKVGENRGCRKFYNP
jgi:argininosuccinate lyase